LLYAFLAAFCASALSFHKDKETRKNSGVASLRGNDGMLHSASNNKAEILNAQFKSAYTQEDLTNLPDVGRNTIPKLPEIRVVETSAMQHSIISPQRSNTSIFLFLSLYEGPKSLGLSCLIWTNNVMYIVVI
jgi:hypothetical protein